MAAPAAQNHNRPISNELSTSSIVSSQHSGCWGSISRSSSPTPPLPLPPPPPPPPPPLGVTEAVAAVGAVGAVAAEEWQADIPTTSTVNSTTDSSASCISSLRSLSLPNSPVHSSGRLPRGSLARLSFGIASRSVSSSDAGGARRSPASSPPLSPLSPLSLSSLAGFGGFGGLGGFGSMRLSQEPEHECSSNQQSQTQQSQTQADKQQQQQQQLLHSDAEERDPSLISPQMYAQAIVALPSELVTQIAQQLDPVDLLALAVASRTLRQLALHVLLPATPHLALCVHARTNASPHAVLLLYLAATRVCALRSLSITFVDFPADAGSAPSVISTSTTSQSAAVLSLGWLWPSRKNSRKSLWPSLRALSPSRSSSENPDLSRSHDSLLTAVIANCAPHLTTLHLIDVPSSRRLNDIMEPIQALSINASQVIRNLRFTFSALQPIPAQQSLLIRTSRLTEEEPIDPLMEKFASTLINFMPLTHTIQSLDIPIHLTLNNPRDPKLLNHLDVLRAVATLKRPLVSLSLTITGMPHPTLGAHERIVNAVAQVLETHSTARRFKLSFRKKTNRRQFLDWQRSFWERVLKLLIANMPNLEALELDLSAVDVNVPKHALYYKPSLHNLKLAAGVETVQKLVASYLRLNHETFMPLPASNSSSHLSPSSGGLTDLHLTVYRSHRDSVKSLSQLLFAGDQSLQKVRNFCLSVGYKAQVEMQDPSWHSLLRRLHSLAIVADGAKSIDQPSWLGMATFISQATEIKQLSWARSRKQLASYTEDWSSEASDAINVFLESIFGHASLKRVTLDTVPLTPSLLALFLARLGQSHQSCQISATIPIIVRSRETLNLLRNSARAMPAIHAMVLPGNVVERFWGSISAPIEPTQQYQVQNCHIAHVRVGPPLPIRPAAPPRQAIDVLRFT